VWSLHPRSQGWLLCHCGYSRRSWCYWNGCWFVTSNDFLHCKALWSVIAWHVCVNQCTSSKGSSSSVGDTDNRGKDSTCEAPETQACQIQQYSCTRDSFSSSTRLKQEHSFIIGGNSPSFTITPSNDVHGYLLFVRSSRVCFSRQQDQVSPLFLVVCLSNVGLLLYVCLQCFRLLNAKVVGEWGCGHDNNKPSRSKDICFLLSTDAFLYSV